VIIVTGGFAILSRLRLLRVALSFWAAFGVGIGGLALAGHAMTARWHLGPIEGFSFWWILVTSPEVLVFLFFMITDPRTAPRDLRGRVVYGIALGALAALLIAPTRTEFAAKVALLGSLAVVCAAQTLLRALPVRVDRTRLAAAAALGVAAYVAVVVGVNAPGPSRAALPVAYGRLPRIAILPSPGVQTPLDRRTARVIAADLAAVRPAQPGQTLRLHLEPGSDQSPPVAVAQLGSRTYRLHVAADGTWALASAPSRPAAPVPTSDALAGVRLRNVAPAVGLDFRQGSFRFGISSETKAMMGGGVCWLDYNGDGRLDLFVVNSYSSDDAATWEAHGGLPTTALFENRGRTFRDVSRRTHADLAVQGDGCVAADLNGDGRPDLVVTTTSGVDILWNRGGRFAAQALPATGWYTGAAVADVNGDGRPDLFVAGYADPNEPVPGSFAGFPTNLAGVRDLLYLNEGNGPDGRARFREVGVQAGLEAASYRHGLGATFLDVNGDGRPDLYVADDEDPNQLYVNVPWPGGAKADPAGLGFRFEERGAAEGVADPFAGMGVAAADGNLFVTNSRGEPSAAYRRRGDGFANARPSLDPALGTGFAGWGASWVDLANSGTPDLVLTAGGIPVTSLARDAEPMRVLAPTQRGYGDAPGVLGPGGLALNGRGLAAADAGNDGRVEIAVNTIGGRLVLLRPSGPSGHWLDVGLSRFEPGAVVTATLPDGRVVSRSVQAGSSYLSSEDPRVHLGLGTATLAARLTVRLPWGGAVELRDVRADRVVTVRVPRAVRPSPPEAATAAIPGCTPRPTAGRSVARVWDDAAVAALRAGDAPEPVQARDLYDVSAAVARAYRLAAPSDRAAAISYTAYRLLLWRASLDANLARTFSLLATQLRALCYSPDFTSRSGAGAALGNRIAAAAIAAGRSDGSNEALHYADPGYTPQNGPLVVAQPGSTVHDATFWQPLALAQVSPRGSAPVPAEVQTFVASQWGRVRTFAGRVAVGPPPLGDPAGRAYRRAAIAAIRATAGTSAPPAVDASPAGWNATLDGLPRRSLARDVELDLVLNGALNDAAVSVYGAKRRYQSPRPIEMIRYLAFNGELPLVPGLTRSWPPGTQVRRRGRWVSGDGWTPPAATPASPGWPSADAAFAAAASRVVSALTGRSLAARAARAERLGVADGVELPADAAEGARVGERVAALALETVSRRLRETVASG
jgi:hypothetical protein